MDSDQKLIARKMFRLRVYEAKAAEYQRLFEKVMQYRDRNFVPIRPYGNIWDRKNLVLEMPSGFGPVGVVENKPGSRRIDRVQTNRGSRPTLSFYVEQDEEKFVYTYQVENRSSARQAITAWDLPVPSIAEVDAITAPEHWR